MPDIIVSKAQAVGDGTILDAHIHIRGELPSYKKLGDLDKHLDGDAQKLELVLLISLPGGTYDRLLGRMLSRKASHFIIAHGAEGGEEVEHAI